MRRFPSIVGQMTRHWPIALFILSCVGALLYAIMDYGFGVHDNSPLMFIPLLLVIPLPFMIAFYILLFLLALLGKIALKM